MIGRRHLAPSETSVAFVDAKAEYRAASRDRFVRRRNGHPMGAGADWHYRSDSDFLRIMEDARDMDRNDALIGAIIDRAVDNTLGDGFALDPDTGDESLNRELAERWAEWAAEPGLCDTAGERTFAELETCVLRQTFIDGDAFVVLTDDGPLDVVEAHRCRTPYSVRHRESVVHGVEMDAHRRRLRYWFTLEDIAPDQSVAKVNEVVRVPAYDADGYPVVLHVVTRHTMRRSSQTRGVSALAPVFSKVTMLEDIDYAKLVQQQVASCVTIFRKRDVAFDTKAFGLTPAALGPERAEVSSALDSMFSRNVQRLEPGLEVAGLPGEEFQGFTPNIPNQGYFEQVRWTLQQIGVAVGVPLILLLMDASETNFSGWRGAVDEARKGFRRNQRRLVERLHRPVYLTMLRRWMREDADLYARASAVGDRFFRHRWNAPAWRYINPKDDAEANHLRVKTLQTSPRRMHDEIGQDFADVLRETIADNSAAIEQAIVAAQAIEARHGVAVSYREVLFLTEGESVTTKQLAADAGAKGAPADAPAPRRTTEAPDSTRPPPKRNGSAHRLNGVMPHA